MMQTIKRLLKRSLARYEPLEETAPIREAIDEARRDGWPRCADYYGDLLYLLIRRNNYRRCLETGFSTGSTAAYMAQGVAERDGEVVSITMDEEPELERGVQLLKTTGHDKRHRLFRGNSNRVMAKFFIDNEKFDMIFMDGWKTFNFLAYEMYIYNQLLPVGGTVFVDDTHMPGVNRAVDLMIKYYNYEEIDYLSYNHTMGLRIFHILSRKSFRRPYRVLMKTRKTEDQSAISDAYFYRRP